MQTIFLRAVAFLEPFGTYYEKTTDLRIPPLIVKPKSIVLRGTETIFVASSTLINNRKGISEC